MASSTVPAFKAALLARLQARTALRNVTVTWGFTDAAGARAAEWMFLGNVDGSQSAAALGQQRRSEDYTLDVVISIVRKGLGVSSAEQRAWEIAAEVEDELRSDASVGLMPTYRLFEAQIDGPMRSEEAISEDGSACESRITLSIRAQARI